jgi:hypothetical protein
MKNNDVYIRSINKRISLNEFKKHMYKEGHVYKINDSYFHKCIGYNGSTPVVESLCLLIDVNEGHTQIIRNVDALPIPSLDFVNKILNDESIEINPNLYDNMVAEINDLGGIVKLILNYKHGI